MNAKYLQDLYFWITERESIRIKKDSRAPMPWTDDPVLATYRFCNVRREDDRVTRWIHKNWLEPHAGDLFSLPHAMAVARMVNLPETLAEMGYPLVWNQEYFENVIADRKGRGEKVWTSAYMITGGYSAGGEPKERIIGRVLTNLHTQLNNTATMIVVGDSLEVAASKLTVPGIGPFLSAQIVADLKWSPLLMRAKDWDTWCAPGPGSTMGLNFLHDRDPGASTTQERFLAEVNELRPLVEEHTGEALDAQNMQNCLCELSKYIRAKYFKRKLKSHYIPYGA